VQRLDSPSYELTIEALDPKNHSRFTRQNLKIIVQSSSDQPPVIQSQNQSVIIREDARVNTEIGQIKAPNNSVFDLPDSSNVPFRIDNLTGIIYSTAQLQPIEYDLRIDVKSGTFSQQVSSTYFHINVMPVNTHTPLFEQERYVVYVGEDHDVNVPIVRLNAFDFDQGDDGRISYSIEDERFRIHEGTGELFLRNPLDFEVQREYSFEVKATDHGEVRKSSSALVIILVQVCSKEV
jgi:hypothetical protein